MSTKVKEYLGEKAGQSLRADVFQDNSSYTSRYFVNGDFIKEETITGHSIHYIEDAATNWINGIKVLNG